MPGRVVRSLALSLALLLVAGDVAAAGCPRAVTRFVGRSQAPPRSATPFIMLSAYNLEPYSAAYLDGALPALARHRVAGVVYTSVGEISEKLGRKGRSADEVAYNREIYAAARSAGASLWLQMRVYANRLRLGPGASGETVTAERILDTPAVRSALEARVRREFQAYASSFPGQACRLIVFEEAGMYHAPQGGGTFWSSQLERARRSPALDALFAERLAGVFGIVRRTARSVDPGCKVGMHLGHSALDDPAGLRGMMNQLGPDRPDFIYYDLYPKAQRDPARFEEVLTRRAAVIRDLGVEGAYLGQLHTMNSFQHGGGRTPSRADIDANVALAVRLKFGSIGFYTKNARATAANPVDPAPFDPNARGQATVYESSKDRWDYGVIKLAELGGVDLGERFDLVIDAAPGSRVEARDRRGGAWTLVGRAGPDGLTVFRGLEAARFLSPGEGLASRVREGRARRVWIIPSEPSSRFRTTRALSEELRATGKLRSVGESAVGAAASEVQVCPR